MTVTDQLKILDSKIKANQAKYELERLAGKISAYSSGDLRKYEYLTGEDLGCKPSVVEKIKFDYSPLGMSLSKAFKKDEVKSIARSKSDFNFDNKHAFSKFYKEYDEFEEMSLDSKYNRMKEFNKLLISFKRDETKYPKTQLRKERIMKNDDELCEKYYNAYKSDHDTNNELSQVKKKEFD